MGLDNRASCLEFGTALFLESKKTCKKAHQDESDLVISLFTCLPIKKEMLIKEPFESKISFLEIRGFQS